jgi:hypothetical protein
MSDLKLTTPEDLVALGYVCDYVNPEMGIAEYSRLDANGTVHMITIQADLEGTLSHNKELETNSNGQKFGDGQIVASIPMPVFDHHLADAVANKDRKFIKRFLNNPDFKGFRTFRGRI